VRRLPALPALLVGALLLAGCADDPDAPAAQRSSDVDVATAGLRAAKRAAGVEPCTVGRSRSDLPDVTLPCLGGGPDVRLSRVSGPLVINLFAQWCGPCRTEMPYYQQLHQKGGDTVRVLGVDYLDTRPDLAMELVRRTGVTYPLLADPDGLLRTELKIRGLPGLALVDADGRVVDVEFRVVRSYAELRELVERHLDVTLPA
jgi:thiol-disulfide isomerase/thioredoxin